MKLSLTVAAEARRGRGELGVAAVDTPASLRVGEHLFRLSSGRVRGYASAPIGTTARSIVPNEGENRKLRGKDSGKKGRVY